MKIYYPVLLALALVLLFTEVNAQKTAPLIRLKNTISAPDKDLPVKRLTKDSLKTAEFKEKYYGVIQFIKMPDTAERRRLAENGVELTEYLPDNAFFAAIRRDQTPEKLGKFNVSGVYKLQREIKIGKVLQQHIKQNTLSTGKDNPVAVSFFGNISREEVIKVLKQQGAKIEQVKFSIPNVVFISASASSLLKIADLPFVNYMNEQPLKNFPINYNNRGIHAVNALAASSGRNLQGKGITIGVGDNANPSTHADLSGRLILRTPAPAASHGTHTTGTVAGGGILNPLYTGMAAKSTIISKNYSDVLIDAPTYIVDHHMVLTNNSYFSGLENCPGNGEYNFLSYYADYQLLTYPELLHVFASGNDGAQSCTPYAAPFATVKSGFQCGKNVLTVGNMNVATYAINPGSSSGPVDDGRLKPEIVAGGTNVMSTLPNNNYGASSGTSMSAPTVTGTLSLLYERFRQLNGGADPQGALIKAIACNTADDLGNPGPDFKFGFGMLNARTAVEAIENSQYVSGAINHGGLTNYSLPVPAGTHQVKIMLYWPDIPASSSSVPSLVNNLDITVTTPASVVRYPLILNPAAGSVNNNAVEGIDNRNNIEQVVLNTPVAGNYTITVRGSVVPYGPQNYILTYQIINPSVTVEYPFGNETLIPGETQTIRWSAHGDNSNSFTIEYSPDNGSSWTLIDNNVASTSRSYNWTVPSAATNIGLVRVTRNVSGYTDQSDHNFTILGQPNLTVTNSCQGYASLSWSAVTSATDYEIMMLRGDSMEVIAQTTGTSYLLDGLEKDSTYWLTVRARNGSIPGRRAIAKSILPSGGPCTLSTFDNDFSVDSVLAPVTGRMYTSSQLGVSAVQVRLRNLGNIASSGAFNVSYRVNGGSIISESISPAMAAHSSVNYTFSNTSDFSAVGTYTIQAWIDYPGDPFHSNDTIVIAIKQLQNDPVILNTSFTEGFETAAPFSYIRYTKGFEGLDRCDFSASNSNGRARTFVNTGFARTGNRCVTIDQINNSATSTADSLILTFNLSSYSTSDLIRLDFFYKNHGINFSLPGNKVWVRGSESSAWIPAFTFPVSNADIGGYRAAPTINVTELLGNAIPAQSFSSSFQIKFGEQGFKSANAVQPVAQSEDANNDNGFSFDDITLTLAEDDVSVIGITQPVTSGICGLSASETISVQVKSFSSTTLTNVPVVYRIDGITTVTENIPSIAPNATITYTFTNPANLSAFKEYTLEAWTDQATDSYHANDTTSVNFLTTPLIASFPYQEGFEDSDGDWYTGGTNSSWQWGTPSNVIINQAANGINAWVTNLSGNYNDSELSYLYSPCFDLSSLANPMLSFSHIFRTEDNCNCDKHWVEYSTNDVNWTKLGAVGSGTNWYDNTAQQVWRASKPSWHTSAIEVPVNPPKIRFRIVMSSDEADNYEGVGIDDIRIVDSIPVSLPLTLLSFTASKVNATAYLQWNTDMESNTSRFVIQKSMDNSSYTDIGSVPSVGNSTSVTKYSFTDKNLLNGTNYYRLKMVDVDGQYVYSDVKTVSHAGNGLTLTVYPNPVTKGVLYIDASANCSRIELMDISGKIIKAINVRGMKHSLNVNDIAKGTYFISVITTEGKKVEKILIE